MKTHYKNNLQSKETIKINCNEKFSILLERYNHLLTLYRKLQNESSNSTNIMVGQILPSETNERALNECRALISRCQCPPNSRLT
jgi:hypothetical protein